MAFSGVGTALMAVFLGLAAVAQLNDPDPIVWMAAYGFPAILTVWAYFISAGSKLWRCLCVTVLSGDVLFATTVIYQYLRENRLQWSIIATEEGRETLGLMIVITWLFLLLIFNSEQRGGWCWEHGPLTFAVLPVSAWIVYKYYIQSRLTLPEHCEGLI